MPYDLKLATRVRERLKDVPKLKVQEKRMFGGLAFMVNKKMCINVTDEGLMCRFAPELTPTLSKRNGFKPMIMRGKELDGYSYVSPEGFSKKQDFEYWVNLCLNFNKVSKSSKK